MTVATEACKKALAFGQYLQSCLPRLIVRTSVFKDELAIVASSPDIPRVLRFLRDHTRCRFQQLIDITAVDYPERPHR